jgi:GNAT superfamily N-acetyltransferase
LASYQEYQQGNFVISTDPARLDLDTIHSFLTRAYWSEGIPKEIVVRAFSNSLAFGIYEGSKQIGVARIISDLATYAYLCDVFIDEAYRGQSLGKWLLACIKAHPDLQGLRRWSLATRDAHELYRQFGFSELKSPDRYMEIANPNIYSNFR